MLLLFTGLFAAAWNGDQSSSSVPQIAGRQDRRDRIEVGADNRGAASTAAASGTRAGAVEFFAQRRTTWLSAGGMLAQSARPEPRWTPFTGSPALLGGTLRLGDDATPILVTVQPAVDEPAR